MPPTSVPIQNSIMRFEQYFAEKQINSRTSNIIDHAQVHLSEREDYFPI